MKPALKRYDEDEPRRPQRRTPTPSYQLELGSKALLALFFGLAIVCGMFFAFGYTMGKHAIPASFTLGSAPPPSSARPVGTLIPPSSVPAGVQPPNPGELSAAESNQTPTTLTTDAAATPVADGTAAGTPSAAAAPPPASTAPAPHTVPAADVTPKSTVPAPLPASGGVYRVQVFAGAQADAESLASALRTHGYPVTVAPPLPGEADLYRVQVGPYLTVAEAQAVRSRLTADGYQAILK